MTPRFRHAVGTHPDWSVATEECLLGLARFSGDPRYVRQPNLGFLYLTEQLAPYAESILTLLKLRTGVPNWVGAVGSGICATGLELDDEPALVAMLGQFAPGRANVFSGTQRPPALDTRTDGGSRAAYAALVHADPSTPELPELIADMSARVASGYLFGGLSSGRAQTRQIADRVLHGGLSGVVFADDVDFVSRVAQGVHPLPGAPARTVARATGHVIEAFAGAQGEISAFDALLEDTGLHSATATLAPAEAQRAQRARLVTLGRAGLFVGIGTEERGAQPRVGRDYTARQIVAIDPGQRSIAVAAAIEPGMRVHYATRDEAAARKDLVRVCAEIRDHLHEIAEQRGTPVEPRGAVYVSCVGRGSHLFGETHEELRVIERQLGDVPLAGFYAGGEIGGRTLYGYTGVLTVFY